MMRLVRSDAVRLWDMIENFLEMVGEHKRTLHEKIPPNPEDERLRLTLLEPKDHKARPRMII